jgi:hypothetical protein
MKDLLEVPVQNNISWFREKNICLTVSSKNIFRGFGSNRTPYEIEKN